MLTTLTLFVVLGLFGATRGSFLHYSNGIEHSQRAARPTTYALNLPLLQRISANLNHNSPQHDQTGCVLHHSQDPEQGEVVQSAAYPHVTLYHSNNPQPQWTPVLNNNPTPATSQLGLYTTPVAYPHPVVINRIRSVPRAQLAYLIPEGSPPVDHGYHHSSPYHQPLY